MDHFPLLKTQKPLPLPPTTTSPVSTERKLFPKVLDIRLHVLISPQTTLSTANGNVGFDRSREHIQEELIT